MNGIKERDKADSENESFFYHHILVIFLNYLEIYLKSIILIYLLQPLTLCRNT